MVKCGKKQVTCAAPPLPDGVTKPKCPLPPICLDAPLTKKDCPKADAARQDEEGPEEAPEMGAVPKKKKAAKKATKKAVKAKAREEEENGDVSRPPGQLEPIP